MFRILCDPSSGSTELCWLKLLVVIHIYFVVCLVGVWQRNFESVMCVYGTTTRRPYRTHTLLFQTKNWGGNNIFRAWFVAFPVLLAQGAKNKCYWKQTRQHNFFFSPEIDGDEFVAHTFVFLIAGFETATTTLSFVLYELALHPVIQNRLRAEIMQVLNKHNGELTYHGIHEMAYRRWPTWTWLCQVRGQNNLHLTLRIFDNAPMNSCILLGDSFLAWLIDDSPTFRTSLCQRCVRTPRVAEV